MKIEILYILDCPWREKTKELIKKVLKKFRVNADIREILIDSDEKARKYNFIGSPSVRINGKDIEEKVNKEVQFVKKECSRCCRIYFQKGKLYPYPPKEMIEEAIKNSI